jgi:hypothetical protein
MFAAVLLLTSTADLRGLQPKPNCTALPPSTYLAGTLFVHNPAYSVVTLIVGK